MSHHCQALVFRCMDFRIKLSRLSELLNSIGYPEGSYDLVSAAGSARDCLSANASEADFIFKQIELSQKLHTVCEVVILYHDNCGAYGIADPAVEHQAQTNDLKKIMDLIKEKFPALKIKTYIIKGVPENNLILQSC